MPYNTILDLCAARRVQKAASEPDVFVKLIQEISTRFLRGKLPEPEASVDFVSMCLQMFVPENTEPQVREHIACNLVRSLDCLRRTQNAEWKH